MKNRICPDCQTPNEPDYIYCKNCGCKLFEDNQQNMGGVPPFASTVKSGPVADNFDGGRTETAVPNQPNPNFGDATRGLQFESIGGIPREEMFAFVGAKTRDIYPKFSKMELTRSKVSWCWPPALLGFGFGPLGAAIWFFYRKMYKIALIFVAIGIITGSATAFLNRDTMLLDNGKIDAIVEENISENGVDFFGLIDDLGENIGAESYMASAVTDIVEVATGIVAGMFALYWYKCFAVRRIYEYRNCGIDPRYYTTGLSAIGSTSGVMAALGVAILYIAQTIFDLIPNLI